MTTHNHNSLLSSKKGAFTVNAQVAIVFFSIAIISSLAIFGVYVNQRDTVVTKLGRIEAQQTAGLIYEHLYSVMRKGWTRQEIDDLIHHIGNRLPDYQIDVVRGEAVAKQFGELPVDAEKRRKDPLVAEVLQRREDMFFSRQEQLRYGFAVKMKAECKGCHTAAKIGDINGVILVTLPSARLRHPIEEAIKPMTAMVSMVVLILFGAIFFVLQRRVVRPVLEFSATINEYVNSHTEKRVTPMQGWPREIISLARNFNHMMDRIQDDQKLLEDQSMRDPLTGLYNRRRFDEFLLQAKSDADKGADVFSILLLDLDGFKPVNDKHGHAAGDAVLVAVAQAIRSTIREADLPTRIGGDEFAIIAVATDTETAAELKERVRGAVSKVNVRFGHLTISAACSIGSATYRPGLADCKELFQSADAEMYQDKALHNSQR